MKKNRILSNLLISSLAEVPVVAIIGPRQCGKTTLVNMFLENKSDYVFLDLESPDDHRALQEPLAVFSINKNKIICIDEIQRVPDLFPVIRTDVDRVERPGRFIILGSASPNLLKQSSETLAGRIRYLELTPFLLKEISSGGDDFHTLWQRGGFPRSYLAKTDDASFSWRQDFIKTFLERDIPLLGFRSTAATIERFWRMLAHGNAQILNRSKFGESLGVSHHTVQHYLDILADCFMIRILQPFEANIKKRLVKSPKIYFRDSGLFHALLGIRTPMDLVSHPDYGTSWETFALENILSDPEIQGRWHPFFYRSHTGEEIDCILDNGLHRIAIEFKASVAPNISKGFYTALKDLAIDDAWVVAPVSKMFSAGNNIMAGNVQDFLNYISNYGS